MQRYPYLKLLMRITSLLSFPLVSSNCLPSRDQAKSPSLVNYHRNAEMAKQALRQRLQLVSLNILEKETGLSRHTIVRARRGERVHPSLIQRLRIAALTCPTPGREVERLSRLNE